MNCSGLRIWLVVGVMLFIAMFHWVYATWIHSTFGYLGFDYEMPALSELILAWMLAVLPSAWLPMDADRPSRLITWVLYLTVFVPSMFVPLFAALRPAEEIRPMMAVLFLSFAIICLPQWLPVLRLRKPQLPSMAFWGGFWVVVGGLLAWVIVVYQGHFSLVGFDEVYESLRFSAREVGRGTGVGYPIMWLSGALMPFLMSWALVRRRFSLLVFAAGVLVLLYSTAGLKSILISAVVTPCLFMLMQGRRLPFAVKLIWVIVAVFGVLNTANLLVTEMTRSHLLLSAIVFARTFAGPGLLTAMYQDFFADHPLTYYSHVNGINLIVPYPYQNGIGQEVGYFYSRNLDLNSNAHLWCSDGLAAMGLPGLLLVSLLCGVVFWVLDSVALRHKGIFSATAINFAALNISNASLFTALLSGGLILSMLLLYLVPTVATESVPLREDAEESETSDGDVEGAIDLDHCSDPDTQPDPEARLV